MSEPGMLLTWSQAPPPHQGLQDYPAETLTY